MQIQDLRNQLEEPQALRSIPVSVTDSTASAITTHFAGCSSLALEARLCFSEAELKERFEVVERARLVLTLTLDAADAEDDRKLLFSALMLLRSFEHYIACLLKLKGSNGHDAWNHLIDAQDRATRSSSIFIFDGTIEALKSYLDVLTALERSCFPELIFQSVAYEVITESCSICGKPTLNCAHKIGELYEGKLCERNVTDLKLKEISIVSEPANRKAVVTTLEHDGHSYDVFTGGHEDGERQGGGHYFSGVAHTFDEPNDPTQWTSLLGESEPPSNRSRSTDPT